MKSFVNLLHSRSFCQVNFIRNVIIKETEIVGSRSLTPEIKLRLITENCLLFNATAEEMKNLPFTDPFWGFYWPGGMSISRYILDNPNVVKGKQVLDFGSGCGATSIACVISKCERVVANDIDVVAEIAAKINSELNNVQIETNTRNLIDDPATFDFDVITFGDVFYDEEFAAQLLPWIIKLVEKDKICIIGDPGRHALSKNLKLKLLEKYELPENACIENHGFKSSNVFKVLR